MIWTDGLLRQFYNPSRSLGTRYYSFQCVSTIRYESQPAFGTHDSLFQRNALRPPFEVASMRKLLVRPLGFLRLVQMRQKNSCRSPFGVKTRAVNLLGSVLTGLR
jgi:hypothetical protein